MAGMALRAQMPMPAPNMPGPNLPTPATNLGGAAKLVSFTGQISKLVDGNPWALNVGDLVQPQCMVVTGPDGYGLFQVSDGSTFEVFANSRVVFRANRSEWSDLLEVMLGRIRVKIEHFGGLPNNNKVRTPRAVISVRGTIFDVTVEDQDATTLVEDEEGVVEVRHLLRPGAARELHAGEYVRVFKNEPLAKSVIDKSDVLRRAMRIAVDVGLNLPRGGSAPGTTTAPPSPGDKKGAPPTPPPPPPPPLP